jgi:hypothetical protein
VRWSAEGARDDIGGHVAERLGGPDGFLAVYETLDVNKGADRPECSGRTWCGRVAGECTFCGELCQ